MKRSDETRFRLPFGVSLEKLLIWALFAAVVYSIRQFFSIVFMTFIMSYLAGRVVGGTTRFLGRSAEHWIRRPIVFVVYLGILALGYLAGQGVLPRALDQGRWLLETVQKIDLEAIREDILAKTLGRIEFTRFKLSKDYAAEFDRFIREKYNLLTYQESLEQALEIRATFRRELAAKEGANALREFQTDRPKEFRDLYVRWLEKNRVSVEVEQHPDVWRRFAGVFEESWRLIHRDEEFEKQRLTPEYIERRDAATRRLIAEDLESKGKFKEEFESGLLADLGGQRLNEFSPEELEERFQRFYKREAPLRWAGYPYSYEKLVILQSVADENEFKDKLTEEAAGEQTAEEKFAQYMERRLARDHPWNDMLGNTSEIFDKNMPTIAAWVTTALNNVIAFGFDALLSLMFSFMIVWEVPQIRRGLSRVAGTRAEPLFNEIAPGIYRLGLVIGRALSAQLLIASLNAAFAFTLISFLGLPSRVFLTLMVLFLSLVPYVGIVIAGVPICLVALQHGGTELGFYAMVAMFFIHELEAWILSPMILGEFLQLNPIVVIFVLFVAQQLSGIWGLLLGVPIAVFFINDVLLKPVHTSVEAESGTAPPDTGPLEKPRESCGARETESGERENLGVAPAQGQWMTKAAIMASSGRRLAVDVSGTQHEENKGFSGNFDLNEEDDQNLKSKE